MRRGLTVTLTVGFTGTSPITVQWQSAPSGGSTFTNISGATSPTLTIHCSPGIDGNKYRAVITNQYGSASTSPVTIHVLSPTVTTQPANATVTAGASATFTAAASGSPAPTVQWQVSTNGGASFGNDTADAGATTGTLTVAATTRARSGYEYRAGHEQRRVGDVVAGHADRQAEQRACGVNVTPSSGGAFSIVLITGSNLGHPTSVSFGSKRALALGVSSRLIIALAPTQPSGTVVDVTVTTKAGTSATSSADHFTYH